MSGRRPAAQHPEARRKASYFKVDIRLAALKLGKYVD